MLHLRDYGDSESASDGEDVDGINLHLQTPINSTSLVAVNAAPVVASKVLSQ